MALEGELLIFTLRVNEKANTALSNSIIIINPSDLAMYTRVYGDMGVNAALNIGLSYNITQATFSFPPKSSDGGDFKLGDAREYQLPPQMSYPLPTA